MADGHKSHPETDISGDTIEFAVVELEKPERVCYELKDGTGFKFNDVNFNAPIEIRVGQTTESRPLFLHHAQDFPHLYESDGEDLGEAWILIQPDVYQENPALGWLLVTKYIEIGRATHPQFRFGRDISRRGHIALSPPIEHDLSFAIIGCSPNPTKVIVDSREHRLWNYEMQE
ncbi:MAG: hypothetical protein WA862_06990 [Solirubrobacterales bacterium]